MSKDIRAYAFAEIPERGLWGSIIGGFIVRCPLAKYYNFIYESSDVIYEISYFYSRFKEIQLKWIDSIATIKINSITRINKYPRCWPFYQDPT